MRVLAHAGVAAALVVGWLAVAPSLHGADTIESSPASTNQAPTPAPDPIRLAKAKVLVGVLKLDQQFRDQVDAGFESYMGPVREQIAALPAATQAAFATGMKEVRQLIQKDMDWRGLADDAAAGYARAYTAKELDGLITFYKSALGQRVVAQGPQLLKDQMSASMQRTMALIPNIRQIISKRMSEAMTASKTEERAKVGIIPGRPFPNIAGTTLDGKPFSLEKSKGKVVLVDFWATWCGPCVQEMPNVIAAYGKYHDKGFEVIGISLDEEKGALTKFLTDKKLPWPQLYDGKGWQSQYATALAIHSIPAAFLLAKDGTLIAADLRGEALDQAIGTALGTAVTTP